MSSAPEHSAETGATPAGALGSADPGVLGVIAELQGKLSALGKAHEDKLKRDEAALAERIKQTDALEKRLADQRTHIEDDARAAAELRSEIEAQSAQLAERVAAVEAQEAQAQEFASAIEGANKDLAQREAVLGRRDAELVEREARAKAAEAQAKERDRKSQEAAARATAATAEAANEAAARAAEAVAATERAEAAEAELERLRAERDGSDRKLSDESRGLKSQLDAATARIEQAETRAKSAESETATLRDQLAKAQASAQAAATSAGADKAAESELMAQAAELEAKVATQGEQIAKRDQAIELLRTRLAEATAAAAEGSGGGGNPESPSVTQRRRRLSRYRQLVQNEARKIVAAKDVLSKRQAECESVIAQRAKLVQQAQALAQREAKLGSRRSVVEATAGVCFAVGAVLLVAALSWGVVSQIFPATYIASAIVSAEARGGREPDLASWQNYHEQLVNDPRLMEEAAARMARRGIESLAKPEMLTARLKADLMLTSDKPGMLRLEFRGQGSERTTRELETYATALVAMANTARESRADGAGTVQSQQATAGTEPVKDERFMYTAGFTAGGAGIAGIVGLIAWTQLSRAKRRYEAAGIGED